MKPHILALSSVALLLGNCAQEPARMQLEVGEETPQIMLSAPITNARGENVGLASIVQSSGALALNVSLSNMPAGEKALHLHTTGLCEAPAFKSAGGHLNPSGASHGKLSENGPHLGDFPNIVIAQDGLAEVSLPITGNSDEVLGHIEDEDGTSVMIHAGPDDYKSDPAGAAGPRIACGVFKAR